MFLVDANVLLALAFDGHQHHGIAARWFDTVEDGCCRVCRITQSAFLRLSSNPALFGEDALRLSDAWVCYDTLMDDPRFEYSLEPMGIDHMWRRLTSSVSYSPKVWTDAYLAAFAITGDMTLVTMDHALASMPNLHVRLLTEAGRHDAGTD